MAWSQVVCMSNFSWRSASGTRVKMAMGTSQRGVETGKAMNNIGGREASVRNRTLLGLFPGGRRSSGKPRRRATRI
jgi:hypothetical protein